MLLPSQPIIGKRCLLSPCLFNVAFEVQTRSIRKEKVIKDIHSRRENKMKMSILQMT